MIKTNFFGYVLIGFVVIIIIKMYRESDMFQLKCIISDVDGKQYCVRERAKLQLAADLLAKTTQKMKLAVIHLHEKYPERDNVKRLHKNFNPKKVKEILPTSKFTAYSEKTDVENNIFFFFACLYKFAHSSAENSILFQY